MYKYIRVCCMGFLAAFSLFSCKSGPSNATLDEEPIEQDSTTQEEQKVDTVITKVETDTLRIDPEASPEEKKKIMDIINKKYLTGRFDPSKDPRFSKVASKFLVYANRLVYMRTEAMEKFLEMRAAALKEGVALKIMSATRPFNVQKAIWERKWLGKQKVNGKFVPQNAPGKDKAIQILEWNSMPSTSRHHWGTDIDINNVDPEYWAATKGKKEYEWLIANAPSYGFCQVYSAGRPYGYQEEKWHWSYIPLAKKFTEEYKKQINDKDIGGFMGAESAIEIGIVKKYVLGINPDCL